MVWGEYVSYIYPMTNSDTNFPAEVGAKKAINEVAIAKAYLIRKSLESSYISLVRAIRVKAVFLMTL